MTSGSGPVSTLRSLALLHLTAARADSKTPMPTPFPDSGYLHNAFTGVASKNWGRRTYDLHVFYARTRDEPTTDKDPSVTK